MSNHFRVAVLAYHSQDIQGNEYSENDHVALAEDLNVIAGLALPVVSAWAVAEALAGRYVLPDRCVALTCDDGAALDFRDVIDPVHGFQRSFNRILTDSYGEYETPIMTSFVIASPDARRGLEQSCLDGKAWMDDDWWPDAVASGRWHLGCHSWDHQHPTLPAYSGMVDEKIRFQAVNDVASADLQINNALRYLRERAANPGDRLFAYPYGNWTDYLVQQFLPEQVCHHGLTAAFTTQPEVLHESSNPWLLPRFVCRADWKSPEQLASILRQI